MLWPRRNVNLLGLGALPGLNSARCDGAGGEPPLNLWYCSATALPLLHYCYGKHINRAKLNVKRPPPLDFTFPWLCLSPAKTEQVATRMRRALL